VFIAINVYVMYSQCSALMRINDGFDLYVTSDYMKLFVYAFKVI